MQPSMALVLVGVSVAAAKQSNLWTREQEIAAGIKDHVVSPLPHTYVRDQDLPTGFTWGNVNGTNYLTKNLNQHIPQYCGSCWAHAAVSALGDRIKIARQARGIDVNLAVQHVLNCGNAGSCHGGSIGGANAWIHRNADGIVFDTCQPYLACSHESDEGFCRGVDANTKCAPENVCRTCSTFKANGGKCVAVGQFPNATIAEHGTVFGENAIMKEIYARGPVGAGIDATQILNYKGGIAKGRCGGADHAISVVGFGEEGGEPYWIVRNSWGEYWGEMGYLRVSRKSGEDLCVGDNANWATPGPFTTHNFPCSESGDNCPPHKYVDPSTTGIPLGKAL